MDCPHCKSPETELFSKNKYSQKRLYCKACRKWSVKLGAPKILLFDIETSQTIFKAWRTGKQYLGWKQIKEPSFIISWAAKWLFDPDSLGGSVTRQEAIGRDDARVVKSIYKLLNRADFVITHNGDKFDIKKLNWKFLLYDLVPNNRYKSLDTLKKCKAVFGCDSYAMDYLAQSLGYDGKHETGIELWDGVEAGDKKSIAKMLAYNINDVYMLEDLYLRTRGWMKTHPNFAIFADMYQDLQPGEYVCPRCLQSIYRTKFTRVWTTPAGYKYKSCNCPHCGAVLRRTKRKPGQRMKLK